MKSIEKIINISKQISEAEAQYSKIEWTQYTTGYDFGCEEAYKKIMDILSDKGNYDLICEYLNEELDPVDKRRVELMYNNFKPFHLSKELNDLNLEIEKKTNELSKVLNTHRTIFEGREISSVELSQILANDENRERRKQAFFATCQVNKPLVDGGFIELINLRKEYAKLSGYKDFVDLQLDRNELDSSLFETWKEQLHEVLPAMEEKRAEYARKYINDDKIMPWDEAYINSKIAPLLNTKVDMSDYYNNISEFIKSFGIDISKFNITYDIFSRANKSEWGYNFTIQTGKDSRILANVKNQYHEYRVLLHETGHAIHSFLLDSDEHILNDGVSGIISEGIANLFGSFLYEKTFFEKFFKDAEEAEKQFNSLREYNKINSLRAIHNIFFDQELYRNPINSLDDIYNIYWKTKRELFKEEPFGEEAPWGFRIHHTTHPIYLHNYFMGDVTCEMLSKVFNKNYGTDSIMQKPLEFGEFLTNEVIKLSGLYKYNDLFRKISGEDFSLKYICD